jgi:hypothetical protein
VHLNRTSPAETIGGGFVDPQGFNSAPPNPTPEIPAVLAAQLGTAATGGLSAPKPPNAIAAAAANTSGRALLQAPRSKMTSSSNLNSDLPLKAAVNSSFVVPLKVMMGISSSFLAQITTPETKGRQELTGTEDLDYCNQVKENQCFRLTCGFSTAVLLLSTCSRLEPGRLHMVATPTNLLLLGTRVRRNVTKRHNNMLLCYICRSTSRASASRLQTVEAPTTLQ